MENASILKVPLLTTLALIAFAANSVLTRMALAEPLLDAASFTIIRLLSGSVVLMLILAYRFRGASPAKGSWLSSLMLFVYALGFSYAYLLLETGTGALILFGMVQITMVLASLIKGQRLAKLEWLGITIAFTGFVYLVWPEVSTPSLSGVLLMSLAGIAWGIYTLRGRASKSPLADTAYNFTRTLPLLMMLALLSLSQLELSYQGLILAVLSGAIASGLGYTVWYSVLAHLSATQAGVLQLLVPVIAALGGVLFVAEPISLRLMLAALLILGGIYLVIKAKPNTN
ncbi:putative inner membrane transporter yiJE [Marinomonas aquimarina]|uniref:Putative inner membrane transporter yiJE n=1 Tax=Marinomonas aquimarina TaxID=295068 RepID=A0A1A8TAW4_9GAMM|nr:DMT family transporter [Marinomonas aquimarina]SBS29220.1 putative inner membrane transporter yiJE [Marinomonas aquimarina]